MQARLKVVQSRIKAVFPAVAFFGGLIWDAITLGSSITSLDLALLLLYLMVAAILLLIIGNRRDPHGFTDDQETVAIQDKMSPWQRRLHWVRLEGPVFALQFCYGSLFSALFIFYFLSSSYWPSFLVVIGLMSFLCLNEFLESHYHRFTLTWTLFGICAVLYFNFALPHLFRSIHPMWFFISTALGVVLVYVLKSLSPKAQGVLWPTYVSAGALVLLYLGNAIPPVPLVKKDLIICRNLEKNGAAYTARIEKPNSYFFWHRSESVLHQLPDEKVFCFTSVFLPQGISCTLYHRWMYRDPKKSWVEQSRISFPIQGGRQDGYRGFTYKRNLTPGRWMVRVETESGRVLGTTRFEAVAVQDSLMEYKYLHLN